MEYSLILGAHGLGDNILSLQCAHFVERLSGEGSATVFSCSRDDVFQPLHHLFGHLFQLLQHPEKDKWGNDNWILNNPTAIDKLFPKRDYSNQYYIVPDLLFRNPYAFDYNKFRCHPKTILSHRLLTDRWNPSKKIYIGLNTTTEGYDYGSKVELIHQLSKLLPDYEIHCPVVDTWANIKIDNSQLESAVFHSNVILHKNPDFIKQLEIIKQCCYGIYTDNGVSHVAYHLGQPRLILDPRFGNSNASNPWIARWRENTEESISIKSLPHLVAYLVVTNINIPQTALLPRVNVLERLGRPWGQDLFFKY